MLEIQGVTASYGRLTAIHDISMRLQEGEITALFGHNGAGKSTLIKSIAGVLKGARGSIEISGRPFVLGPSGERPVGLAVVPQGTGIFPSLSVGENIELGLFAFKKSKDNAEKERLLDLATDHFPIIRQRWHEPAKNLSGGQRQMVSIARALVTGRRILLLDEPSTGLAPKLVEEMMETFGRLRDSGITILLAEQNVRKTLICADQVCVMKAGRLILTSSAEEFAAREDLWNLF